MIGSTSRLKSAAMVERPIAPAPITIGISSAVMSHLSVRRPFLGARHVLGEAGPDVIEVEPERRRIGMRARFAVLRVFAPPAMHSRVELLGDRFAEPRVEATH